MMNEQNALPPTTAFGVIKSFVLRLLKPTPRGPVLIVDDEEPVRRFVERVLGDVGYKTVSASNGREALEIAKRIGPLGGLVTDVQMPGISGEELARVLRQSDPELKVLYLTGYSNRLFAGKSALSADEAYLEKPCSVKALREALSLLLFGSVEAAS